MTFQNAVQYHPDYMTSRPKDHNLSDAPSHMKHKLVSCFAEQRNHLKYKQREREREGGRENQIKGRLRHFEV
jgi:hypothetical protein